MVFSVSTVLLIFISLHKKRRDRDFHKKMGRKATLWNWVLEGKITWRCETAHSLSLSVFLSPFLLYFSSSHSFSLYHYLENQLSLKLSLISSVSTYTHVPTSLFSSLSLIPSHFQLSFPILKSYSIFKTVFPSFPP